MEVGDLNYYSHTSLLDRLSFLAKGFMDATRAGANPMVLKKESAL